MRPLTPDQLRGPSYHDWTIAQVLGHLGSQAEIFMAWVTAAVEGTEPPGSDFMQPIWDAWDARDPDERAADALRADRLLVERLEGLTGGELMWMRLNLFGMELDSTGLPRLRLAEHALHTWDIAVALNSRARLLPEAVALLIDTLGSLAARTGQPQDRSFRVRVQTSEPSRAITVRVGDAVEVTEWTDGPADGEVFIPAEAFVRLVYGRLDARHAPDVELSGSVTLNDLRRIFPGP